MYNVALQRGIKCIPTTTPPPPPPPPPPIEYTHNIVVNYKGDVGVWYNVLITIRTNEPTPIIDFSALKDATQGNNTSCSGTINYSGSAYNLQCSGDQIYIDYSDNGTHSVNTAGTNYTYTDHGDNFVPTTTRHLTTLSNQSTVVEEIYSATTETSGLGNSPIASYERLIECLNNDGAEDQDTANPAKGSGLGAFGSITKIWTDSTNIIVLVDIPNATTEVQTLLKYDTTQIVDKVATIYV